VEQRDLFHSFANRGRDEVARILTITISGGGKLPSDAGLNLSTVRAEHSLDEQRIAGLTVARRPAALRNLVALGNACEDDLFCRTSVAQWII
jgi:hypothetical protein